MNEPSAGFGHVDGPARTVSCHRIPATTCDDALSTCTSCIDMSELLCASMTFMTAFAAATTDASQTPFCIGAPGIATSPSLGLPSTHTPSGSGAPISMMAKLADGCATAWQGF
jgi:hypothetical protein